MVRYDKFFGGIAQDDRMQSVGQYTYGQNIDIRKGKWIQLSTKSDNVSRILLGSGKYITSVFEYSPNIWWIGTSDGKIVEWNISGNTLGALFDTGYTNAIIDMKKMNANVYFFSNNRAYVRTSYTDGNTWTLGGNVTLLSTVSGLYNKRQSIIVGDDIIFFLDGTHIKKCTSATPTSASNYGSSFSIAFQTQDAIVGITLHGNSLWAYGRTGVMYALDNQSEEVIGIKDFKERIVSVKNAGDYDIVITSTDSTQYSRAWYMNTGVSFGSSKLIRRYKFSKTVKQASENQLWGNRFGFDEISDAQDWCFTDCGGIIYWVSSDQGQPSIYSYGKTDNVLPDSLSIISSSDSDGISWYDINAIWSSNGYLYISQLKGTECYLYRIKLFDYTETLNCNNEGYIITKVDDFGQYEIPKTIKQVMVGADIPAGTSIELEYSINESEFTPYRTFTNTDAIGTNGKKFEFSEPIEMFNEISWKITLITTDETLTPKLYGFSHLLESELYEPSQ